MATAAAELLVAINATTDGLRNGLDSAQRSLKTAGRNMERAGLTLTKAVTAPIAAIGVGAVKAFSDFDQAMTESLSIMSDVTDMQRREMTDAAKEVARETTLSAEDAAESYFFLASAGLDAEESIAALPQVARLAQAGAFDMATATDLATDSMSAMGLETEDLTRVTDVMTKANEIANTSVEQFGKALTNQAGPALRNVGKSIEEGGAMLAVFADQGIKAEKAGVLVRQSIDALTAGFKENKRQFEEFGIELFDAQGNMRNMADITEDFEHALGGMSDRARAAAFQSLGLNVKVRAGIQALMGNSEALREYQGELENAGGTTERVAEKQMQSFANQLELAKQNVVLLGIELGENLAPIVQQAAEFVGDLAAQFEQSTEETQSLILGISSVAASMGPVLIVVGKVVAALGGLGAVITGLATAGGALVVFAGAAGLIIDNWGAVKDFFQNTLFPPIKEAVKSGLSAIKTAWADNKTLILGVVGSLLTDAVAIFESIKNIVLPPLESVLGRLLAAWNEWGDNIIAAVGTAFSTIVGLIEAAGNIFVGAFQVLEGIVNPSWSKIWEGIKNIVDGAFDAMITLVGGAAETLLNGLEAAFSWLPVIGPKIDDAREAVSNFIDQQLKDEVDADAKALESSVSTAHEGAQEAVESAQSGIETAWGKVKDKATEIFGTGGSGGTGTKAVQEGASKMKSAVDDVTKSAEGAAKAFDVGLTQSLEAAAPLFTKVEDRAKIMKEQINADEEAVNELAVTTEEMNEQVQQSVKDFEKQEKAIGKAEEKIGDLGGAVADNLIKGENAIIPLIDDLTGSLTKAGTEGVGTLVKALTGGKLKEALATTTGSITALVVGVEGFWQLVTGQSFIKSTINAFKQIAEGVTDAVDNMKEEFQGFTGMDERNRGGRQQGSGNFSGSSIAYALSKIPGVDKIEASQIAPNFKWNPTASTVASVTNFGIGGIERDRWFLEAQARVRQGAPALADGATIFGPTAAIMGEYPGARSNPELVAPADKMQGYIDKAVRKAMGTRGGQRQTINVMLDGEVIARAAAEGLPRYLDLVNLR